MAKVKVAQMVIPIYSGTLYYTDSLKKFNSICKKVGSGTLDSSSVGATLKVDADDGAVGYLIGVFDKDDSTLAHEVCHLTFMVLDRAGIDPRDSDNEAFCYLMGWLFDAVKKLQPQLSEAV